MNRSARQLLHTLLVVAILTTGVVPVAWASPARAAERGGQAGSPRPIRSESAPAGAATAGQDGAGSREAAQDAEPIDPGDWDQGQPAGAADSAGNTYAVWTDLRDGLAHIRFAERPPDGNWSPSVKLDPTGTGSQWLPGIAVDGAGNPFAVWDDRRGAESQIYFTYRPAGGDWGVSQPISPTAQAQESAFLAVNRRGEAAAVWRQGEALNYNVIVAFRPVGGDWEPGVERTGSGGNLGNPDVALDDWGRVYVTWEDRSTNHVCFVERSPGGSWSAVENVRDSVTGWTFGPQLAVDGAGNAHAVWEDTRSGSSQIYAAYRPAGGSWSANVRIDDGQGATTFPSVAVDGAGNAVAVWSEWGDVFVSVRYTSGGWLPPGLLAEGGPSSAQAGSSALLNRPRGAQGGQSGKLEFDGVERVLPSVSEAAPVWTMAPQGLQSPVGLVVTAWEILALLGGLSQQGRENVKTGSGRAPGSNRCGNTVGGQAAAWRQAAAPQASLLAGGDACHAGNAVQPPAQGADEGQVGLGKADGDADGRVSVETRVIEGITYYVVDTPGTDTITTDLNQAKQAVDAYNQAHPPEQKGQSGQPADNQGAKPEPAKPPANADPPAKVPSPGQPAPGEEPPPSPSPSPPPWTPRDQARSNAFWLLDTALQRPLTKAEKLQLLAAHGVLNVAPHRLLSVFSGLAQIGPNAAVESIRDLEGMTSEGFDALEDQVIADKRRRDAEEAERQRQERERQRLAQQKRAGPKEAPIAKIGDWRDREIKELGSTYYAMKKLEQQQGSALAQGREYRYDQTQRIREEKAGANEGLVQQAWDLTHPVLPHSGEFVHEQTPLWIPGRGLDYAFQLSYHSQLIYDGPVGYGWEHSYERRMVDAGAGSVALQEGNGRFDVYLFDGATYTSPAGRYTALVSTTLGITITDRYGGVEIYHPLDGSAVAGRLRSIADRNGNALQLAYDGLGRLQTVTDTLGRDVTYSYDGNGRVTAVTDFAGRAVALGYDGNGDLVSITTPAVNGTPNGNDFPLGKTIVFSYTSGFDDERLNHNLTTIIGPNEVADGSLTPRTVNTYGTAGFAFDRVVNQSWGGGRSNGTGIPAGGDVALVYTTTIGTDAPAGAASRTIITDRGGNVITLWHDGAGHRLREQQMADGQAVVTDYAYNGDGQMTSVTYPVGNQTEHTYDGDAADRLAQGNLLETRQVADAARGCDGAGTPCADLVTTYTYEPNFQAIQSVTDPGGNTVSYAYDDSGNLLQVTFPTVTLGVASPQAASQSWTYNAWGQPLTATDAEGHVTCFEYYDSGPMAGYQSRTIQDCVPSTSSGQAPSTSSGQASSRSSGQAMELTTEYAYDEVGNVTVMTDARGIRTEFVVNALNQVVKATRNAEPASTRAYGLRCEGALGAGSGVGQPDQSTALDYEIIYWYDANDNLVRTDVENVAPDLDGDFHPSGANSRDATNPWLTTEYAYDLLDNVVRVTREVTAASTITVEQRYDALENLIAVTDPEGNRTEYAYDERHLLSSMSAGAGSPEVVTTTYNYDANGNLVRSTDGEGNPTDFVYDGFERQVGRVDALGNVSRWQYDPAGNQVSWVYRDGQDGRNPARAITATAPVTLAQVVRHFDERSRVIREEEAFFIAAVGSGTLTPVTTDGDGDGWVETATSYDRNGNVTSIQADSGSIATFGYDSLDRMVLITDALTNTIAYWYDASGNTVQSVATERPPDGMGVSETFTLTSAFDALNRPVATSNTLGQTWRYAYDSRGNIVFFSDANGPVSVAFAADDGGSTTDGFGRLATGVVTTAATNGHGNTTLFTYDGLNRLVADTSHLREGGVGERGVIGEVRSSYTYDGNGNLTRLTDPNGNQTAYGYDSLDRTTAITYADGTTETMTYDRAHNLAQRTDPNGSVVTHTYDEGNRLVRSDVIRALGVGGTTLQTFAWDGLSRMTAASDNNDPTDPSDDTTVTFTYDSLSNLVGESQDGYESTGAFDGVGNLLSLAYPDSIVLTYTYDALDRVCSIQDGDGEIASFDYIGPWRLHRQTYGNDTYVEYDHDGVGRVTDITYRRSSDDLLLSSFSYTYDRVGNRTSEMSQPGGDTVTYTYDSLYRLTGAQGSASEREYAYDAAGNRVWVTEDGATTGYSTNLVNEYESVNGESRTHDASGNLLSRRFSVEAELCIGLDGVTAAGPVTATVGVSAAFTASASPPEATLPVTYTWEATGQTPVTHSGGLTSTVAFTWAVIGPQFVTMTAVNPCGQAVSDSVAIAVQPVPCAAVDQVAIVGPIEGYTGTLYGFSAVITPAGATEPVTYTWLPQPASGQGTASALYEWDAPGVYSVTLRAENCGGPVSAMHLITIRALPPTCPRPLQGVDIQGPTTGYSGTLYGFTGVTVPSDATEPVTFTWSPDPASGQGTAGASYRWVTTGVHTVTLTAENCGGPVSATHLITVTLEMAYRVYLPLVLRASGRPVPECVAPIAPPPAGSGATKVVTETLIVYSYDFVDRLIGVTEWVTVTVGGDVTVVSETVCYTYDALGYRLTTQAGDGTARYVYASDRVIEERDGDGALAATYLGGLSMERGGNRYFYQTDGPGSVRGLADENGDVVERVEYDPFGAPAFSGGGSESAMGNPCLFRGRRYDGDVGLYVYGGRRYDPVTGRHTQRTAGAEGSPYAFRGNNPLGGVQP